MEEYLKYISNNYVHILLFWLIGLPVFLFWVIIRGIIYIIFNEEPFGFFCDLKSELKNIKFSQILIFLAIYTLIIFGVYIPKQINNIFIPGILFIPLMIWFYILEHRKLINKKLKRKLNFDDRMRYTIILVITLFSIISLGVLLYKRIYFY